MESLRKKQTISDILIEWKQDPVMRERIVHWHTIDKKAATLDDFPDDLHTSIQQALKERGINQLYSHQRQAFDMARSGQSFTAVTPTASGKSLCYHLPVLQNLEDPSSRAIYLFPTKALGTRSKVGFKLLIEQMEKNSQLYV